MKLLLVLTALLELSNVAVEVMRAMEDIKILDRVVSCHNERDDQTLSPRK